MKIIATERERKKIWGEHASGVRAAQVQGLSSDENSGPEFQRKA